MTGIALGPIEAQLSRLRDAYPGSSANALPDGTTLVTIQAVPLPHGWTMDKTDVSFILPVGYPMARPDCFFADASLRLLGGGLPMNSNTNQIPHLNENRMWFSWHLATWNPTVNDLLTYVRVIEDRLRRAM